MMLEDDGLTPSEGPELDALRQVKLRLPTDQVMKLHRLRILKSEPISNFVADALDQYFEEIKAARAAAQEAEVTA